MKIGNIQNLKKKLGSDKLREIITNYKHGEEI